MDERCHTGVGAPHPRRSCGGERTLSGGSDFELDAEFDDLSGWEVEVAGGWAGDAGEEHEELLAPLRHLAWPICQQNFTALIEGDAVPVELASGLENFAKVIEHVWRFGETVVQDDAEELGVEFFHVAAMRFFDVRGFFEMDGEEDDLVVKGFVVFEMVKEGEGESVGICGHEHGGTWDSDDAFALEFIDEEADGEASAEHGLVEEPSSVHPCFHDDPHAEADGEGEPCASEELQEATGDVAEFEGEEDDGGECGFPEGPFPDIFCDEEEEDAGEGHVERDGEAVGCGEVCGRFEVEDEGETGCEEEVVDLRHVDLASDIGVGVDDFEAREVAELHGLLGEGVHAGDHGLRCDDGCGGCEEDDGDEGWFGDEAEEMVELRFESGFDIGEDECALAEVVEHEGRHHDDEPAFDEGRAPEVADVGVHGFASGHGEEYESHQHDAFASVMEEKVHAVVREERGEDAWVSGDVEDTEDG